MFVVVDLRDGGGMHVVFTWIGYVVDCYNAHVYHSASLDYVFHS
jgi:hypothetical protein